VKNSEEALKNAIKYDPDLIDAKYNLALVYENNNRDRAKELYMEVLEQDPTYEEAKNALVELTSSEGF
jgi:tetratricopeptide (TPR) repeat protein